MQSVDPNPSIPVTGGAAASADNVIILTGGLTGSSALAGLLTKAGYWCGEDTFKKSDYNTYENAELIELNRRLMKRVGVAEKEYTMAFQPDAIRRIEALRGVESDADFRAMIARCEEHAPWVWKDPRLWLTVRFWAPLLDWGRIRVLLLRREPVQAWISTTQRRQIQTYRYQKEYNDAIQASLREFLAANGIRHLSVLFEDLIVTPEQEVARLSDFLGHAVTMEHFRSSYEGDFYRKPKQLRDGVEAALIYLKNYGERLR
jgi:hypothetical protein